MPASLTNEYAWSASAPLSVDTMWYYAIAFQDSNAGIYALTGAAHVSVYRKTTEGGTTWNDNTDLVISGIATSCIRHVPGTTRTYLITGNNPPERKGFACTNNAEVRRLRSLKRSLPVQDAGGIVCGNEETFDDPLTFRMTQLHKYEGSAFITGPCLLSYTRQTVDVAFEGRYIAPPLQAYRCQGLFRSVSITTRWRTECR
jgi:hypothetical protein